MFLSLITCGIILILFIYLIFRRYNIKKIETFEEREN